MEGMEGPLRSTMGVLSLTRMIVTRMVQDWMSVALVMVMVSVLSVFDGSSAVFMKESVRRRVW